MRTGIGRRVDRRIAWSAFGLAVALFALIAALSDAAEPLLARRDPAAALAVFQLMRAGEQVDHIVDFTFTRVNADGQRLTSSTTEARFGRAVLVRVGDSLTVELPTVVYDCQRMDGRSSCRTRRHTASAAPSQVTGVEIALGAYDATELADELIAGERARCFRIRVRSPAQELPDLGHETTRCLASDGTMLRTRVVGALFTNEWVAARVQRRVDAAALGPILAGFDQAGPQLSG